MGSLLVAAAGFRRRTPAAFLVLVSAVIAGSFAVQVALLGRQSYWVDELFSVSEASGSAPDVLRLGADEVHTPLYAGLLWAWMKVGGTGEAWARSLSLLCVVIAVPVAHRGLRGSGLDERVRWTLTAATAAGGVPIAYALEARSYALLILGAVGLTVATLRAGAVILDGGRPTATILVTWTGWSALAATTHLFGAVLTLAAFGLLSGLTLWRGGSGRWRGVTIWTLLTAAGCAVQAGWLVRGLHRPGFAGGTDWIPAPGLRAVRDLATTTFASGGLATHKDGYAWTSPVGVLVAVGLCLAAVLYRLLARRGQTYPGTSRDAGPAGGLSSGRDAGPAGGLSSAGGLGTGGGPGPGGGEGPAGALLLGLATLVVVPVFAVSQWKHLWTLRNLVVVWPAASWGTVCLVVALAGTVGGRRRFAGVVVVLLGAGLIPTAIGVADPYKTDFRGLFAYLARVRDTRPDATFLFVGHGPPLGWGPVSNPQQGWTGAGGSGSTARSPELSPSTVPSLSAVVRTAGTEVVVLYRGVADRHLDRDTSRLVERLGAGSCRQIPIYGLGVVRCN